MSPLQQSLYRGFLASAAVSAALEGRKLDKAAALSTLPAITAVKKLCSHPDLVYDTCGGGQQGAKGSSKPRAGGRSTGGGGGSASGMAPVITGFEGLQGLFSAGGVYPAYKPGAVQTLHSGKFLVLESLLKAVRLVEPTDKVVRSWGSLGSVEGFWQAVDGFCGSCHLPQGRVGSALLTCCSSVCVAVAGTQVIVSMHTESLDLLAKAGLLVLSF